MNQWSQGASARSSPAVESRTGEVPVQPSFLPGKHFANRTGRTGSSPAHRWAGLPEKIHALALDPGALLEGGCFQSNLIPHRLEFRFNTVKLLLVRWFNLFDTRMAEVPYFQTGDMLLPVVRCMPQHRIHPHLLNIITRAVVGSEAGFHVHDDDLTGPSVDKVVFSLEPMVRMNSIHAKFGSRRIHKPRPCNFPRFRPGDVAVNSAGMGALKVCKRIAIRCWPWWA